MLEKLKNLSLKNKITYSVMAVAIIVIVVFAILYFCSIFNLVTLCLVVVLSLFAISVANLVNVPMKEDKKLFIYNLVFTCLIFACCLSLIILLCMHPEAISK